MKTPRTSKQRKPVFEARFARLLESELEKATLVLNAKAITDKLQKQAEDLAKIEADDIMPVLDAFKEAFGPEVTEQFSSVATQSIRTLLDAVSSAKDAIGTEVMRLEKTANGEDTSDMALDSAPPPGGVAPEGAPAPGPDGMDVAPASKGGAEGDLPVDLGDEAGAGGDEDAMVGGSAAGRARKESALPRGRRLREFAEMHLQDNIEALRGFEPKAGILASQISQAISRAHLDDGSKRELSHALGHLAGVCINPAHFEDPDQKIENVLMHAHLDARLPEVRACTSMLKKLAHMIAFKHEGVLDAEPGMHNMLEGVARNVRRLRESANPDAVVLASFRKGLSKGAPVREAAARTARSFAIDVSDVVCIVKEARRSARPFVAEAQRRKVREGEGYTPMFPLGGGSAGSGGAPGQTRQARPGKASGARRVEVDEDDEAPDTGDGTSDAPAAPNTSGTSSTSTPGTTNSSSSTTAPNAPRPPNAPQSSGSMQPGAQQAGGTPQAPNAPQAPKPAYAPKGPQQAAGGAQAPVSGSQPRAPNAPAGGAQPAGGTDDDAMAGRQQSGARPGVTMPGKTLNRAPNAPR